MKSIIERDHWDGALSSSYDSHSTLIRIRRTKPQLKPKQLDERNKITLVSIPFPSPTAQQLINLARQHAGIHRKWGALRLAD